MNKQQIAERAAHKFPENGTVEKIEETSEGYLVTSTLGCFVLNELNDTEVAAGMSVTIYHQDGISSIIQGIDIDSKPVFFKTESELRQKRIDWLRQNKIDKAEQKKLFYAELADPNSDFNTKLNKLPKVFQQRIRRFFRLGDEFWDVAVYELYTCMAAVKIAYACRSETQIWRFKHSSTEEHLCVLEQDILNYLSAYQFTFACALACSYIRKAKSVIKRPGAMQILAGAKMYTG